MKIGLMLRQWLVKLEWFSTLFPRIPVPIQQKINSFLQEKYPAAQNHVPVQQERDQNRDWDRNRDRGWERERDRNFDRERDRVKERSPHRDRSLHRDRDRSRDCDRYYRSGREQDHYTNKDRDYKSSSRYKTDRDRYRK